MKIKGLIDEDFVNYKKPSMFITAPYCTFKCDKECGSNVCQNSDLAAAPVIEIDHQEIINRFNNNPITEAIVLGGLEPFYMPNNRIPIVRQLLPYFIPDSGGFTNGTELIIYTGYNDWELSFSDLQAFACFCPDAIIKFGRFIPGHQPHYDELLGVNLASDNQYAIRVKDINIDEWREKRKIKLEERNEIKY